MAIRVEHQPAAGVIGQAAHDIGYAQALEARRAQAFQEELAQQQVDTQQAQVDQRGALAEQEMFARQQLAEQQMGHQTGMAQLGHAQDLERRQHEFALRQQAAEQQLGQLKGGPSRELKRLQDALVQLQVDPTLRPDERQALTGQLMDRMSGIQSGVQLLQQQSPPMTLQDEFMQQLVQDPLGNMYYMGPDGKPMPIDPPEQTGPQMTPQQKLDNNTVQVYGDGTRLMLDDKGMPYVFDPLEHLRPQPTDDTSVQDMQEQRMGQFQEIDAELRKEHMAAATHLAERVRDIEQQYVDGEIDQEEKNRQIDAAYSVSRRYAQTVGDMFGEMARGVAGTPPEMQKQEQMMQQPQQIQQERIQQTHDIISQRESVMREINRQLPREQRVDDASLERRITAMRSRWERTEQAIQDAPAPHSELLFTLTDLWEQGVAEDRHDAQKWRNMVLAAAQIEHDYGLDYLVRRNALELGRAVIDGREVEVVTFRPRMLGLDFIPDQTMEMDATGQPIEPDVTEGSRSFWDPVREDVALGATTGTTAGAVKGTLAAPGPGTVIGAGSGLLIGSGVGLVSGLMRGTAEEYRQWRERSQRARAEADLRPHTPGVMQRAQGRWMDTYEGWMGR